MTKRLVISTVSAETGIKRSTVEIVVDKLLSTIAEEVSNGRDVRFADFGTFRKKTMAARKGRNPHTGETVAIPERVLPDFRAAKKFKEMVK